MEEREKGQDVVAEEEPGGTIKEPERKKRPEKELGAEIEEIGKRDARLGEQGSVMDLVGGLRAWSVQVDPEFPQY